MNRHYNLGSGSREFLSNHRDKRPGDQIRRGRFNANLRYHDGSTGFCGFLVFLDHIRNISNLSSDIKIVGAILSASFEAILSVKRIWANGADEDFGFLGKFTQIRIIQSANFNGCKLSASRT